MCKASVYAKQERRPVVGEKLSISVNEHGHGVAHSPGKSFIECVVCFKTGDELALTLPAELCTVYGLDGIEHARFIEQPGDEVHMVPDFLAFPNHPDLAPIAFNKFGDRGLTIEVIRLAGTYYSMKLGRMVDASTEPVAA